MNDYGFRTHGNGYEWEAAFKEAFKDDPDIGKIRFDCEAGGFFCYTTDLAVLEEYGVKFRDICMNVEKFTPIVSQGIKRMEQWLAEQEKLMSTVRGALLENPSSTFEIMTPDGNIRITPQDAKQLLDGDMQFVHIDGTQYCAFELLDQEIVQKQTDLFDKDIIRIKTQEPELSQIADTEQKRENTQSRLDDIYTILDGLKNHPMQYDDRIIRQIIECVVIESKEEIKVIFIGGLETTERLKTGCAQ